MVKGLEESQRQKVSCPTTLPFHPTTQNGPRPVPPIRLFSCGLIPTEKRSAVMRRVTSNQHTLRTRPVPPPPNPSTRPGECE